MKSYKFKVFFLVSIFIVLQSCGQPVNRREFIDYDPGNIQNPTNFNNNDPVTNNPINGGWSNWAEASSCSVECGGGQKTFTRTCTNPAPENNGQYCVGESYKNESCNTQACPVTNQPVDGGWSGWTPISDCSATCGGGSQTFSRTCTNPVPQNGGSQCVGETTKTESCNTHSCNNNTDPISEKVLTDFIICSGSNVYETTIIGFYQYYCFRCPEREGLNYWMDDIILRGETLTQVQNNISHICTNEKGYPSKTNCERQSMNGTLCPDGYNFLPNNSTSCFKVCQE